MISKRTRAQLVEQLRTKGTLAESQPANTITREAASDDCVLVIAGMISYQRRQAIGQRWLPSSAHQKVLP